MMEYIKIEIQNLLEIKDEMIHKNELQKNRPGQLYFHRYKKNKKMTKQIP